jgi:5'-nucleotidase
MSRTGRLLAPYLLALFACSSSGAEAKLDAPGPTRPLQLTVVGINDVHGGLLAAPPPRALLSLTRDDVGGADWFGGWLTAIRADAAAKGGEVLLVDAGDEFQGTLISNQFQGRSVVEVFDGLGVAAAALGNHEFDFGLPVLLERMKQASYPILCANVFEKGTRRRPAWARPSALLDLHGLRVGVIGVTTVETPLVTNPVNVAGLEFPPGGPIAAEEADALRARGATVVIVAAHAGPLPPGAEAQRIAEAVAGKVDLIVSGHHHTLVGPPPLTSAGVPIVQAGTKLQYFSVVELGLDEAGRVRKAAVNEGTYPRSGGPQPILHTAAGRPADWRGRQVQPDARIAAIVHKYDEQVQKLRESRIGTAAVELRKGGRDDTLGHLVSDALRSGAGGSLKADFALANAGGLRVDHIPAGPVTFGQVFDLYPFDNQQVVVTLPASEVRDALEAMLRSGKAPMHVSGLRYTVELDRPELGKNRRAWPAGAIVTEVVDEKSGKALCSTRSCTPAGCDATCAPGNFTVSLTDFLVNGGDGLNLPKDAPRKEGTVLVRDIIVSYVKAHDPITADLVGGPQRITIHGARGQSE